MRTWLSAAVWSMALACWPVLAQPSSTNPVERPSTASPQITDLAPMTVSGVQPGPGLWKISRDGHALWVLGTLAPLPKRMEWRSQEVEQTIAQSQELLLPPMLSLDTGRGMFRTLFLLPALFKAAKNPDGKSLQQVVPADQYARWSVLKARYIGSDRSIEQRRPIFAALELYNAAMKRSSLTMDNVVRAQVEKLARRGKLTITDVTSTARLDDPRAAIKEFQRTGLNDQTCFARTLEVIDHEIDTMRSQANAWALGDVEALRDSPQSSQFSICQAAVGESAIARKFGFDKLRGQSMQLWLQKAQAALSRNPSTVALLPMGLILGRGNLIDELKARGYTVEAPGEY